MTFDNVAPLGHYMFIYYTLFDIICNYFEQINRAFWVKHRLRVFYANDF
jgi:hypothetical protein